MTQKPSEKLVPALLQSIDPRTIADSEVRQTVTVPSTGESETKRGSMLEALKAK